MGASLKDRRQSLVGRTGLRGYDFARAYAAAADEWLQGVFDAAVAGASTPQDRRGRHLGRTRPEGGGRLALMAVGGFGRSELSPGSDLDLVLIHEPRHPAKEVKAVAEAIWYPIWDQGVRLDHSVRTTGEALAVAAEDLKAALGLLDARLVAGDKALAGELADKARSQWQSQARRRLPELIAVIAERHHRYGEVAFLLEPDLKEGHGGLRDYHAIRALAEASPVLNQITADPDLHRAARTMTEVRVELQRRTGRPSDVLLLQEQDGVAEALDMSDADSLMALVAGAARRLAWAATDSVRRVTSWLEGPKGHNGSADRALGPGLVLRDGEVNLTVDAAVSTDLSLTWRAGAMAAQLGAPLARTSLERLAAHAPTMAEPWPEEARHALVGLLGAGPGAIEVLEALDQHGLVVRLVPEWAAVRNKPQRNAYHRYTVDRHLCEAAAQAAGLVRQVARPDLLLVGAWLHDIGKGFPGDHTEVGIEVVGTMAPRMGFGPGDSTVLVDMVRHHLLLADTATRRDLDDPATIEMVAQAVRTPLTLELVAALTEADSLATGPAAWGHWKAQLVAELAQRAHKALAGGGITEVDLGVRPEHRRLIAAGQLALEVTGATTPGANVIGATVTVAAPDQPGLLSCVAGVLALHGLDIRSATASPGAEGMAIDIFEIAPSRDREPDWARVQADLAASLEARLALESRLAERARTYGARRRPSAARPAQARVIVDNDASASATVVEVRAPDGVGVLFHITAALAACRLNVSSARVNTLGHEVVDSFYVRTASGTKLTGEADLIELEEMILAGLAKDATGP
ncbi:MAG: [protein-PII] uridylyltransferase [Acidimicrobiales bacterium]